MSWKKVLVLVLIGTLPAAMLSAAEVKSGSAAVGKEGNLYMYGDPGGAVAAALTGEFGKLYPGVKVDLQTMKSGDAFTRHMNDLAGRRVSADILWLNDITLQAALVKDDYALPYTPAADSAVSPLASIGDRVFVTGFDPVVMVYNRDLVTEKELPLTRSALLKALAEPRWQGKVGVCDPEKSQLAFLLLTQDLAHGKNFWGLVRKFGDAGVKVYPDYRTLLERVESGEITAACNLPLSEVLHAAGPGRKTGWAYTTDYVLALPQTVLISKRATNPAAARLWIDFLRSARAQETITAQSPLFPVRSDVAGGMLEKLGGTPPPWQTLRMIGTGAETTRFSEGGLKRGFLLRWKQLLKLAK